MKAPIISAAVAGALILGACGGDNGEAAPATEAPATEAPAETEAPVEDLSDELAQTEARLATVQQGFDRLTERFIEAIV